MKQENFKNIIESALSDRKISRRDLAKLTGICNTTLNDLINGNIKRIDINNLIKIIDVLDLDYKEIFRVAGYEDLLLFLIEKGEIQ